MSDDVLFSLIKSNITAQTATYLFEHAKAIGGAKIMREETEESVTLSARANKIGEELKFLTIAATAAEKLTKSADKALVKQLINDVEMAVLNIFYAVPTFYTPQIIGDETKMNRLHIILQKYRDTLPKHTEIQKIFDQIFQACIKVGLNYRTREGSKFHVSKHPGPSKISQNPQSIFPTASSGSISETTLIDSFSYSQ